MVRIYKSDLYYWWSTTSLITFITLRKTVANCSRKLCYRRKTAKPSYTRNAAYKQITSGNVSNILQGDFIALSCHRSRPLQKQISTLQTDVLCYARLYFFIGLPARTLAVTGFQPVPDVWDNLNLQCHLNQVDLS